MITYFKNIYSALITILIGMRVTFSHLFTRSVTLQYPREKRELPEGSRQKLDVNINNCIGCLQCEKACPVDCIKIETVRARQDEDLGETPDGRKKRMHITRFDIDMGKCCYCGLCVDPCPSKSIFMIPDYEFSTYDRKNLILNFCKLSPERIKELKG